MPELSIQRALTDLGILVSIIDQDECIIIKMHHYRIEPESPWMCLVPEMWADSAAEAEVMKDMKKPDGEEWEYKDRRQEIVFIGKQVIKLFKLFF